MNIKNIDKENCEVVVSLSADELVKLSNVMYCLKEDEHKNGLYYKLYSEIILARDICQYGHIDGFALDRIVKLRSKINEK